MSDKKSIFSAVAVRLCSFVIAILIVISVTASAIAEAATVDFDVYIYMADNMLSSDTVAGRQLNYYLNDYKNLSQIWVDSVSDDFLNGVKAWETVNLICSPSDVANKPIEAKGYYITVLLSMLECTYENDNAIPLIDFTKEAKNPQSLYGSFAKFYK
ncbi:MAG: hypothetical protein NC177_16990, partial [Ruminococcus flavefaciens]|nr:hypothetical protein [Ruminococcus flavefaciens]